MSKKTIPLHNDDRCSACAFFLAYENDVGECRRYAPRPIVTIDPDAQAIVWPGVMGCDWCGEWAPIT